MPARDPYEQIREAHRALQAAYKQVHEARQVMSKTVRDAHAQGVTYQEIADILDVTRQRVSDIAKG